MEIPKAEPNKAEKKIEERGLQVFSRITVLSARQQVEAQVAKMSCDEIRMLLDYYHCEVGQLIRKIFDDKIFHRTKDQKNGSR